MKQISFAQAAKVSEIKHVYGVLPRKDKRGIVFASTDFSSLSAATGVSLRAHDVMLSGTVSKNIILTK